MALREFKLPDPGEGLTEADLVTWHVAVGDVVKVNDIVVEVETAKSLVELPIPFAGTVAACTPPRATPSRSARSSSPSTTGWAVPRMPPRRLPLPPHRPLPRHPTRVPRLVARGERDRRGPHRWHDLDGVAPAASPATGLKQTEAKRRRAPAGSTDRRWRIDAIGHHRYSRCPGSAPAPWPSRRCASSPRTSASTSPPSPHRRGWHRHPRRRRGVPRARPAPRHPHRKARCRTRTRRRSGSPTASGDREARLPDQGRAQGPPRRRWSRRPSPRRTSPSGSPVDVTATMDLVERLKADREFRTSRSRRCSSSPRRSVSRCGATPASTPAGTRPRRRSSQALRQPRHRRGDPPRAPRAEHQGCRRDDDA
jgi:2-oxoisovalerate dehydrogenase E2 component (dihydrolipoyl transacylase)